MRHFFRDLTSWWAAAMGYTFGQPHPRETPPPPLVGVQPYRDHPSRP
ncbi:hypothetical protein [Cyanobium sp. Morenito 9A2]|nr:hypothetical protein [Cyanobium sp. Morenito 9A2]MCP9850907.1 hypothetical protein [Cyanobium sp. Morenito 9A2]